MEAKDQANFKNAAYTYMAMSWQRTADVWGGVRTLRESGIKYLTQFVRESDTDYGARKLATEFYNVFGHTIDSVVGMICNKNLAPTDPPDVFKMFFRDVDLLGNDFVAFTHVTLTNAVRDGHSFILVSAPPPVKKEEGEQPTFQDVADRRAFWINYKASQLINWQYEVTNGKLILTQATFEECTYEPDGAYGEKKVTRYRVLKPGSYSLYQKPDDGKGDELIPLEENVPTGGKEITLAVCYAKRTAPLESVPPFMDLLETNVTHYNSQSVLREALKYIVPMPIFHFADKSSGDEFKNGIGVVAANRAFIMTGPETRAEYLELKGQSIPELRIDIANLETRMAKMGVEKFEPVSDGTQKTATEVGSDNRKELSEVAMIAKDFENCIEQAIYFTAQLENGIRPQTVNLTDAEKTRLRLNIDYDKLVLNTQQIALFNTMVTEGNLSKHTFLSIFEKEYKDQLPDDWTVDDEVQRLKDAQGLDRTIITEEIAQTAAGK